MLICEERHLNNDIYVAEDSNVNRIILRGFNSCSPARNIKMFKVSTNALSPKGMLMHQSMV